MRWCDRCGIGYMSLTFAFHGQRTNTGQECLILALFSHYQTKR